MPLRLRQPGPQLIGLPQEEIIQHTHALMDFDVSFQVGFDQRVEDGLHHAWVGVTEGDQQHVAAAGHIHLDAATDDGRGLGAIRAAAYLGEDFFRTDDVRHQTGEVKAGQDFDFGIDDVVAAGIGRFDAGILIGRHGVFALQNEADENFGLGLIHRRLGQI